MTLSPDTHLTANFKVKEFFCTSQDNPAGVYQFSPKLWAEFQALPDNVQAVYEANLKKLAVALQKIRDKYDKPLKITSGWRSVRLNKQVGGSGRSKHLEAMAADVVVEGVSLSKLHSDHKDWPGGLARGPSFVHFDVRNSRARWMY